MTGTATVRVDRCFKGDPGGLEIRVWLANCYFAHDSLEFPVLLRFCDARSGRPVHPFHR
jgi:hypothetical protein